MAKYDWTFGRLASTYDGPINLDILHSIIAELRRHYGDDCGLRYALNEQKPIVIQVIKGLGGFKIEFHNSDPNQHDFEVTISNVSPVLPLLQRLVNVFPFVLTLGFGVAMFLGFPLPNWFTLVLSAILVLFAQMTCGAALGIMLRLKGEWFGEFELIEIGDIVNRVITGRPYNRKSVDG